MRRHVLRILAVLVAGAAVVFALRGRVPDPADIGAVLAGAHLGWLVVAIAVQFLSQAAFARQQRALLSAFDVGISRRDALAITYSRSAISMVLPAGLFAYLRLNHRERAPGNLPATTM